MYRIRFKTNSADPRPINWPIKHPYWISGYDSDDNTIIISYADSKAYILDNWPEAFDLDVEKVDSYSFSSRFPKPKWFNDEKP